MPPALFFLNIAVAIQGLLWVHTNFSIVLGLFYFCEKCHWNFIASALTASGNGHFNNINYFTS